MKIEVVESAYLKSNMYVLIEQGHITMIDPCENYIIPEGMEPDYIFLTHEHYDHISAVNYWKERSNAKVICSSICGSNIKDSKRNLSKHFGVFLQIQTWIEDIGNIEVSPYETVADIVFPERLEVSWKGHKFFLFITPGHSKGSSSILLDNYWLFAGDTLMKNFPVSFGLPGGSKKDWLNITKPAFLKLPENTVVMPGHFECFALKDYAFWEVV